MNRPNLNIAVKRASCKAKRVLHKTNLVYSVSMSFPSFNQMNVTIVESNVHQLLLLTLSLFPVVISMKTSQKRPSCILSVISYSSSSSSFFFYLLFVLEEVIIVIIFFFLLIALLYHRLDKTGWYAVTLLILVYNDTSSLIHSKILISLLLLIVCAHTSVRTKIRTSSNGTSFFRVETKFFRRWPAS